MLCQRTPLDEHRRAFQLFDVLGQGAIDFVTLKRVAKSLNLDIPDEELQVSGSQLGGEAWREQVVRGRQLGGKWRGVAGRAKVVRGRAAGKQRN